MVLGINWQQDHSYNKPGSESNVTIIVPSCSPYTSWLGDAPLFASKKMNKQSFGVEGLTPLKCRFYK